MDYQVNIEHAANKLADSISPHDAHVGIGDGVLFLYVTREKWLVRRYQALLGSKYEGFPLKIEYAGKIKPA